ncbi:phospho-N-acetylmuramoyl-pentapeptide-transferase, partial [bacterium]|nr:phospho-N-acetylmuramoyl-pentapeptide-transferase [bacterium]
MIYLFAQWMQDLGYSFFRLLEYTTVRSIAAVVTTLLLMLLLSPKAIRILYRSGSRDKQRSFDPHLAKSKSGTPTMGGIVIILSVTASMVFWGDPTNLYLWLMMGALLVFGMLGAVDDLAKVRGGGADKGLSRGMKLVMQTAYGLVLGLVLYFPATSPFPSGLEDCIGVLFLKPSVFGGYDVHLGWLYVPFVAFVIVAVSNAVNLIDGLDGLAAGTAIPPILVYGTFAFILSNRVLTEYFLYPFLPGAHELVVFVAALAGALIGFLWYNGYPAEVFMGDTGSLALGGVMASLVLLTKQELLFIIAGGLFIYVNATHLIGDRIGIHMLGRRLYY